MTTRNELRSNTNREAKTREVEEEYVFEEPDALSIPDSVQARFDSEDMSLRWIRISVKGQGSDDPHTDTWDTDTVKVLGLLNSDWNSEEMGGGFMYDNKLHFLKPTNFVIFDSNKVHCAQDVLTDKKRFAIDYAVKKA